jgi:chlorobactene glucosyltransferase
MEFSFINHQIGIIVFLSACLLILITNLMVLQRLGPKTSEGLPEPDTSPLVSILIPARNEEISIRECIVSLLLQDYPNIEIIVLDDHSNDNTENILRELATTTRKLKIIEGEELPPGWLGKNWACYQLGELAKGSFLLFTDADTRHEPNAVREAVWTLISQRLDFLSALPLQIVETFGEKLLVPSLYSYTQSFISLNLSYLLPIPGLSASIGQFMLIRRDIYKEIGGHEAIRDDVADDLALVRQVKAHKRRWRLFDGTALIRCRMYRSFSQVFYGFSKNFFSIFGNRIIPFLFIWIWLGIVFLEPPVVLLLKLINMPVVWTSVWLALIACLQATLLWGLTLWRFRFPFWIIAFYPITVLLSEVVAMNSLYSTLLGQSTWKGRSINKPKISWF